MSPHIFRNLGSIAHVNFYHILFSLCNFHIQLIFHLVIHFCFHYILGINITFKVMLFISQLKKSVDPFSIFRKSLAPLPQEIIEK